MSANVPFGDNILQSQLRATSRHRCARLAEDASQATYALLGAFPCHRADPTAGSGRCDIFELVLAGGHD